MQWYMYLLIAIGTIFGLIFVVFVLSKLTRPSFKKFEKIKAQQPKIEPKKEVEPKEDLGLNLNQKFGPQDFEYAANNRPKPRERRTISPEDLEAFKKKMNLNPEPPKPKTLAEQIKELSPELKAILFNGGLARKEYDFKSKKD